MTENELNAKIQAGEVTTLSSENPAPTPLPATFEEIQQWIADYDSFLANLRNSRVPASSDLPLSIPLTAAGGDTTTTIVTDDIGRLFEFTNGSKFLVAIGGDEHYQRRNTSTDWAAIDNIWGAVKIGQYVYVLLQDTGATPDEWRIYRYDIDNLAAGGTLMTFSGTTPDLTVDVNLRLACDGTFLYLNYDGGNSASAYVIAKYSISGTALTYVSSITCGSATLGFNQGFAVLADGSIYTIDTTNRNISKFSATGTLEYTDDASTLSTSHEHLSVIEDALYCYNANSKHFEKMFYS